jgi:hypothetical protein
LGVFVFYLARTKQLTPEYLKIVFGLALLILVSTLAGMVLNPLLQMNSSDTEVIVQILTILAALGGAFAQWAFNHRSDSSKKDGD